MKLRNHIIDFIFDKSKDERFDGTAIEKSGIASLFFLEPMFTGKSAHNFIQNHWTEIVEFKNEFMLDTSIDIFSCPETFLNHLFKQYARIILASITLDDIVEIDECFRRKLENLLKI